MAEKKNVKQNIYPQLIIKNNENPSRLLAFPFIGILIKIILLIPVAFVNFAYSLVASIYMIGTPFVILFTGKYWDSAYDFNLKYMKFTTKINLYVYGLTDKYPGFGLDDNGIFTLKIDKPTAPSRLLAFPLIGFLIRIILLIPYLIFQSVIQNGSYVAVVISWFAILFTGKYPESLYEFNRDSIRIDLAQNIYSFYLSDTYPSFYMAMKNKTIKILLIVTGVLLLLANYSPLFSGGDSINSDNDSSAQNYNNKSSF